jgi:RNA polymerase-interacting CarD/CdnL/TRCF family regulator
MQFMNGDLVVHPAFGIGHITDTEEKQFPGQAAAHLYYKVTRQKDSMWIQVESQEATGLRLVTVGSDLDQYRALLKSPPVPLNANQQQRQQELTRRLQEGSFRGVCEVMRDLTAWQQVRPLGQADATTLQKTRVSLYEEWAATKGVTNVEAIREVDTLLLQSRQLSSRLV